MPQRANWRKTTAWCVTICGLCLLAAAAYAALNILVIPKLVVDETEKVVSETYESQHVEVTFRLANHGSESLVVTEVIAVSSCCSSVLNAPRVIAAGHVEDLRVRVTAGRYGTKAEFHLRTNDPIQPDVSLRVTTIPAVKPPFFVHDPSSTPIEWDVWKPGSAREFAFSTVEPPDTDLWIADVSCDAEFIEVTPVGSPMVKDSGKEYVVREYRFTIRLLEIPALGRHKCGLSIRKSSGADTIVNLGVQSEPSVRVVPRTVLVDDSPDPAIIEFVDRDSNVSLFVEMPEGVPDWLDVSRQTKPAPAVERFELRLRENATPDGRKGVLKFLTRGTNEAKNDVIVVVKPTAETVDGDNNQ